MSTISLRVHVRVRRDEKCFSDLLTMLEEYRDTIEEVAFFTGYTHPPMPLAAVRDEAKHIGEVAIPAVRKLGLRVGINHLATLGHLDENPTGSLQAPWQRLVDISGAVSPSCYCVSDPQYMEYVRECYASLAAAGPDFIWVDDDVRMESHPKSISLACFCPFCLRKFEEETGREWSRESLVEALDGGTKEDRLRVRRQWIGRNGRYISDLLSEIRSAVDAVDPEIVLGLMTGETHYSELNYEQRARALSGGRDIEVKWRPGGGFYTDDAPLAALDKAHGVGRQIAYLPTSVTDVQYEHENFPYQMLRKSRASFGGEILAAVGAGCTGVALNILNMYDSPTEHAPYFEATRKLAPFIKYAADICGRSAPRGVYTPFTQRSFAAQSLDGAWGRGEAWGAGMFRSRELAEIGVPMAYSADGAEARLLTPENCSEYAIDELLEMLSHGVLMDALTLIKLHDLGLGEQAGFRVAGRKDTDSIERLTAHPLNGRFAGAHRDCRPSFYPEPVYTLEPIGDAEVLSEVIDFQDKVYGAAAGVFTNSLGGRVAVFGYYPWHMIQNAAKVHQLREVCRWIAAGGLTACVESYQRAALWVRTDGDGRPAILALNPSSDTIDRLEIAVAAGAPSMAVRYSDGRSEDVEAERERDGYRTYVLHSLGPWQAALLHTAPDL